MSENKVWFDGLQALRGILFLTVFISHSGSFITCIGIYGWGGAAVETFFILSGFLAAHTGRHTVMNSLRGGG